MEQLSAMIPSAPPARWVPLACPSHERIQKCYMLFLAHPCTVTGTVPAMMDAEPPLAFRNCTGAMRRKCTQVSSLLVMSSQGDDYTHHACFLIHGQRNHRRRKHLLASMTHRFPSQLQIKRVQQTMGRLQVVFWQVMHDDSKLLLITPNLPQPEQGSFILMLGSGHGSFLQEVRLRKGPRAHEVSLTVSLEAEFKAL